MSKTSIETSEDILEDVLEVEKRILWLATLIVHEANRRRDPSGIKVGGHQASTASCVSLLTALYFNHARADDRISVKPHASPALYAIQYLLGNVQKRDLKSLRAFGGLQAYPSQTKNPHFVDFSTGSVGLGAAAVNFSALTAQYLRSKNLISETGNFWAVVGDAELDEGNVWEALAEPLADEVPGIRWVVDLNRQSLDRVVPGLRVRRLERLFEASGWRVIEAKYGQRLTKIFEQPGGEALKARIDSMPNEEYQSIISGPKDAAFDRLILGSQNPQGIRRALEGLPAEQLVETLTALGGHDQAVLKEAFVEADSAPEPAVIFAYTIKGWGLPFAGDPMNHSAIMSDEQMEKLAADLGVGGDWHSGLSPEDPGWRVVARARDRLARPLRRSDSTPLVSATIKPAFPRRTSSQEAFGRVLTEIAARHPEVSKRLVTVAPDVSISTNLAGWINRVGSWRTTARPEYGEANPLLRWRESPSGQHLELGISEMNLFGLLAQLGLASENFGVSLAPIGTVYDTFISRGLDSLVYGLYCGASLVVVGTPSGVSLAPEGGAHQSTFTPSLGIALPGLVSYEPCFAKETEWVLLAAINRALSGHGSSYLRLSTLPIDQDLFPGDTEALRNHVLNGAYRIVDRTIMPGFEVDSAVLIFASGVTVPTACEASEALLDEGVYASVFNITSADQLYRIWSRFIEATIDEAQHQPNPFPGLIRDDELGVPSVSIADAHPHALAFLGTALGVRSISLGVSTFGESGTVDELHRRHHLDAGSLVNAAIALVDAATRRRGVYA